MPELLPLNYRSPLKPAINQSASQPINQSFLSMQTSPPSSYNIKKQNKKKFLNLNRIHLPALARPNWLKFSQPPGTGSFPRKFAPFSPFLYRQHPQFVGCPHYYPTRTRIHHWAPYPIPMYTFIFNFTTGTGTRPILACLTKRKLTIDTATHYYTDPTPPLTMVNSTLVPQRFPPRPRIYIYICSVNFSPCRL